MGGIEMHLREQRWAFSSEGKKGGTGGGSVKRGV